MSLEVALAENTATMRELIGILSKGIVPPAPAPVEEPKAEKKAEKKAKPAPVEEPAAAELPEDAAPPPPPVTYEEVKSAITRLAAAKGRAAAVALLTRFGVKSGLELKPAQYAEALAAANEALR